MPREEIIYSSRTLERFPKPYIKIEDLEDSDLENKDSKKSKEENL